MDVVFFCLSITFFQNIKFIFILYKMFLTILGVDF